MPRLNENERLPMLDLQLPHWGLANALPGGPIVLPIVLPDGTAGTYAVADLQAQRTAYQTLTDAIFAALASVIPLERATSVRPVVSLTGYQGELEVRDFLRRAQRDLLSARTRGAGGGGPSFGARVLGAA